MAFLNAAAPSLIRARSSQLQTMVMGALVNAPGMTNIGCAIMPAFASKRGTLQLRESEFAAKLVGANLNADRRFTLVFAKRPDERSALRMS